MDITAMNESRFNRFFFVVTVGVLEVYKVKIVTNEWDINF